jgi:hypothetical protein
MAIIVGVAAPIACKEGTEWKGLKYRLGRNTEVFDAELFALLLFVCNASHNHDW